MNHRPSTSDGIGPASSRNRRFGHEQPKVDFMMILLAWVLSLAG
jgi:hypothetical protein